MKLEDIVRNNVKKGYKLIDARSKVAQDVILSKISKSNFKNNITIKGGIVMQNISNSVRRATRDLDLDFIKYSLEDTSIKEFINRLNLVNDNINIKIIGKIEELHQQDYQGKRVYLKLIDNTNYEINTKLDIGVHKLLELSQEDYYFNLDTMEDGFSLFINSPEQIFTEKLKSLLKLGFRSTRYKDLFDFYYLINYNKLNSKKLLKTFKLLIFNDNNMPEKTIEHIYERLKNIFNSSIYIKHLNNPQNNWLDISVSDAINTVLNYIENLSTKKIVV